MLTLIVHAHLVPFGIGALPYLMIAGIGLAMLSHALFRFSVSVAEGREDILLTEAGLSRGREEADWATWRVASGSTLLRPGRFYRFRSGTKSWTLITGAYDRRNELEALLERASSGGSLELSTCADAPDAEPGARPCVAPSQAAGRLALSRTLAASMSVGHVALFASSVGFVAWLRPYLA